VKGNGHGLVTVLRTRPNAEDENEEGETSAHRAKEQFSNLRFIFPKIG
jgi:hypothetical protein